MVLQKSGFDVLKGGSNPFHDGNKNNRLDKKNIEEKPKYSTQFQKSRTPQKCRKVFDF
jgi:hypothetical protein